MPQLDVYCKLSINVPQNDYLVWLLHEYMAGFVAFSVLTSKFPSASAQAEYMQMKVDALQDKIASAEETFRNYEKQLVHGFDELNKRILEHDECVGKGTHVEVCVSVPINL